LLIADVLTFAKSIFNVQQPEYISAPCSVSFALVADSTESNVLGEEIIVKDTNRFFVKEERRESRIDRRRRRRRVGD